MQYTKNGNPIWMSPQPGAPAETSYEVGYRKPPITGRFKKGQSGNSKGRPKKPERFHTERQRLRDLIEVFHQPTTITIGGKRKTVPLILCILHQAMNLAAKGSYRHFVKALELYKEAIELMRELNPKAVNHLESVEKTLGELFTKHDPTEEILNEMRRKTRKV